MSIQCYKCNTALELGLGQDIPRSEECPECYASLRTCRMCSFYDTASYNECREPSADRLVDKEKANFCDYYKLGGLNTDIAQEKEKLMSAADLLFKK